LVVTPITDERSAVIQRAEYEPPRVLLMDLTNDQPDCSQGDAAAWCSYGAGF